MNEAVINAVAKTLEEWNPLGESASSIKELNGYYSEAIDIIDSHLTQNRPVKYSVNIVLQEAFGLVLDKNDLVKYSKLIEGHIGEN